MSLEELKNDWDAIEVSTRQNVISDEQIKSIIKAKYRSFVSKVLLLDLIVLFVYLYFMVLTIFRFDALGVFYLKVLGILSIVMLAVLFLLRLLKLRRTYRNRFLNHSHSTAVKNLAKEEVRIQRFYLVNIVFGFLLTISLIILNIKIYNEFDLVQSRNFWLTIIPCSFVFILLMNQWIRRSYLRVVRAAAALIQELE